jgi:type VI secretion system secreted protein VgrG
VVGPEGLEIHTDAYGRIKVQFHWDREGNHDQHSSCWIRAMQPWAGAGWGFQFLPRVGMEVLVQFLGGDTDSPLVVGCLYNGLNAPPFPLPQQKSVSGIRTQSTKGGGGFNELSFDDRKGFERLYVHAEKDLDELVEHNHTETVQNDEVIRIGSSQLTQIGLDRRALVGGNAVAQIGLDRTTSIGRDDTTVVKAMRRVDVAGSLRVQVGRDRELDVKKNLSTFVGGSCRLVAGANYELYVGDAGADDAQATLAANGRVSVLASTDLVLEGEQTVTLKCGDTRLVLTPEGVTVATKKVQILGDQEILLDAGSAVLKLDDNLLATAQKSELHGQASSLVLDANASLDGTMVKLNCGAGRGSAAGDDEAETETKPFALTILDPEDQPLAGKRYELAVEELRLKGTTDGGGKIEQDIPVSARTVQVTVWATEKRRLDYLVQLEQVPAASELTGAQIRLRNLAYYHGDAHGELDDATAAALRYFQHDYELPESGELDEATQAKLAELAKF